MSRPTEAAMLAPYVHPRVIKWGDTDAAHIAYTVRFFDFAMEAIEGWFRNVLGIDWYRLNMDLHMGTPFVQVNMDIMAPLTPRDELRMIVLVEKMGRSSLAFGIRGERTDGVSSFKARFVCSLVDNRAMKSIPIPPEFRARIEHYMEACAACSA
ncbi:MAG TPA: thioesterase family protein [Candidatus Competibacteraceae bacterium]|nr:thioesterase family protein [Candidatus Competibacteraceae bacterium]